MSLQPAWPGCTTNAASTAEASASKNRCIPAKESDGSLPAMVPEGSVAPTATRRACKRSPAGAQITTRCWAIPFREVIAATPQPTCVHRHGRSPFQHRSSAEAINARQRPACPTPVYPVSTVAWRPIPGTERPYRAPSSWSQSVSTPEGSFIPRRDHASRGDIPQPRPYPNSITSE